MRWLSKRISKYGVYIFLKKTGSGASLNKELAQEFHTPVTKKIKIRKGYVRFKDNIWVKNLAEKRSLLSFNCGFNHLLCVMDFFTKYASAKRLKVKKF